MRERIKINSGETASEQLNNEAKKLDESIKRTQNSKSKVGQKDSGKGLKELAYVSKHNFKDDRDRDAKTMKNLSI